MAKTPNVLRDVPALRERVRGWHRAGETVALVPTMGALHDGHLSLVRLARAEADRVVVSIFVNPKQFTPSEDFARYPRHEESDLAKLASVGTDAVFAPTPSVMYPEGFATTVTVQGPAEGLESASRPHFFAGVATVVTKLLLQAQADVAVFGEKDFQQLRVVERLVRDLDIPTRIVAAPTFRSPDGVALSSRNAYLSAEERARAPKLYECLTDAAERIAADAPVSEVLAQARLALETAGFRVDYVEARHASTLASVSDRYDGPVRLLAAVWLGATRLIDNVPVPRPANMVEAARLEPSIHREDAATVPRLQQRCP